ncbi:MAG TPA: heavy-metal-associated domain-containing protein [Waddliaceae bacterium]
MLSNFQKSIVGFLFVCWMSVSSVEAEILKVTVRLRTETCNVGCFQLLKDNLKKVNGVTQVNISPASGSAELNWDPNQPFSYYAVNAALQMVGVGLINMGVKASGAIEQQGENVILRSNPDNTKFVLISPQSPNVNQYTPVTSPTLQGLSPDLKLSILEKSKPNKIVTVEGTIFRWYAPPPLYLVVERITFETPKI